MRALIIDHSIFDSLSSIAETSFCHVAISRPANDCGNVARSGSTARTAGAAGETFDHLRKIFECSSGRGNIARHCETNEYKEHRCLCVVRIDGKSSQFGTLGVFPPTQCIARDSYIHWDAGVARVEFLCSLRIGQRALPFTAPAI